MPYGEPHKAAQTERHDRMAELNISKGAETAKLTVVGAEYLTWVGHHGKVYPPSNCHLIGSLESTINLLVLGLTS